MQRLRLRPFRTLSTLTCQNLSFIAEDKAGLLHVETGTLARYLNLTSFKLRQDLKWLREKHYLTYLSLRRGRAVLAIYKPSRLSCTAEGGGASLPSSSIKEGKDNLGNKFLDIDEQNLWKV
jgi:hypothetical protein